MKWKFYFLLSVSIVFGCKQDKDKSSKKDENSEIPVEFALESLTEKDLSVCDSVTCPEITINYLQVKEDSSTSEKINKKIQDFVITSLDIKEDAPKSKSVQDAATNFANIYLEDIAKFPDIVGVYTAQVDVKEIYRSPHLISLELSQYLFTGGAHGNGSTVFLNVDPENGNTLQLDDVLKNREEFNAFAEKRFRNQHKISSEESINSTGFWFEQDRFYLPETVGFTLDSLVFVYNNYEITNYADSPVEFKIPREEAKTYLKTEYNL